MNSIRTFLAALAGLSCAATISFAQNPAPPTTPAVSSGAIYVPDLSHAGEPLKTGSLAWNSTSEEVTVPADSLKAEFLFSFTNVSDKAFAITTVHPSCGCTTAHIPQLPWLIQPGASGEIPISVNIGGKTGMVFKSVYIATERGNLTLMLRINIQAPVERTLTDTERMQAMEMAKVDRQAVFKGDCASCHIKNIQGKYSKDLYDSVCGICHEAKNRASMVPDLHDLKVPTNTDFWQTWITFGKPGTLMPAFAAAQGGPLTEVQIASLAAYLNVAIPSHVPQTAH